MACDAPSFAMQAASIMMQPESISSLIVSGLLHNQIVTNIWYQRCWYSTVSLSCMLLPKIRYSAAVRNQFYRLNSLYLLYAWTSSRWTYRFCMECVLLGTCHGCVDKPRLQQRDCDSRAHQLQQQDSISGVAMGHGLPAAGAMLAKCACRRQTCMNHQMRLPTTG